LIDDDSTGDFIDEINRNEKPIESGCNSPSMGYVARSPALHPLQYPTVAIVVE
jgi:hypothetical protein